MTPHACHLVAAAVPEAMLPALPCAPVEGLCAVTGVQGPCLPRSAVISDANCDAYLFAAPASPLVSVAVYTAWNFGTTKPGAKRQSCPERQSCWWCDGREFRQLDKAAMRAIVLEGSPSTPWAMWVTTSYKKHGTIRTRVNRFGFGVIGFDERLVDCSRDWEVVEMWERLRAAQDAGIPRPLIEALDIAPGYMAKIGWRFWRDFERWARPLRLSPLYQFLTYLLPSQEELKACATNATSTCEA